jgi:hypothetical protein
MYSGPTKTPSQFIDCLSFYLSSLCTCSFLSLERGLTVLDCCSWRFFLFLAEAVHTLDRAYWDPVSSALWTKCRRPPTSVQTSDKNTSIFSLFVLARLPPLLL